MHILHGTWIPDAAPDFIQRGGFYLWVEAEPVLPEPRPDGEQPSPKKRRLRSQVGAQNRSLEKAPVPDPAPHPHHLPKAALAAFLADKLGLGSQPNLSDGISPAISGCPAMPVPLASPDLARFLPDRLTPDPTQAFHWQAWRIDCYRVGGSPSSSSSHRQGDRHPPDRTPELLQLLPELNLLAQGDLADFQLGTDLKFWLSFFPSLKAILRKDQYIPALRHRLLNPRSKKKQYEIYHCWEIVSPQYETVLAQAAVAMPWACATGFADPPLEAPLAPAFRDRSSLLRHFCEVLLDQIICQTELPESFVRRIEDTLVHRCWRGDKPISATVDPTTLETYQQWQGWRDRIATTQTALSFNLYFVLQNPPDADGDWQLLLQVSPKSDPSLQVPLADYWRRRGKQQKHLRQQLGDNFEQQLLLNLGYAARIYPKLWQALETDRPQGIALGLDEALDFLHGAAWILEDAGYRVVVPAWWTPQGRRRAKIKLRAKGSSSKASGGDAAKSYFSVTKLREYDYDLSIGNERLSHAEWEALVESKSSLVHFRGQWMELDQDKMRELMAFWQKGQDDKPELGVLELIQLTANSNGDVELDLERDQALSKMVSQLQDKSQMVAIADPTQLHGTLRDYQRRGVSWLSYLESLGLNGCLADDMGLGKTIQVIARLVQEREPNPASPAPVPKGLLPTLLVAPTSVIGNWLREITQFAPELKAFVHHGSGRLKTPAEFKKACRNTDVVITSFTLARSDLKLLQSVPWQRIVLDEAQNIKNPKAVQTKAILKLEAPHRLALTGTPVENRLLDLWSIFNFLNPGYLGKENQFRRNFERPIQRYGDVAKATMLKQLVEPFILRRVKTDASIIKDLPDKVEQKVYCHLTKEQASLYEVVVKDIEGKLDTTQGMERRGLILGSLTKLKQICNHPAQFLHDGSDFSVARSHKLERLAEMTAEVISEGESLLIFTQFREIGDALEQYLRQTCHYNTHWLHGGTAAKQRDRMIAQFQDPATPASVFILSLKAGGVGITLTKANHVFHFDRWWNPAVEDQATDRAFRIGQKKTVFVHKFVATGTLEERIDEMIEDKKKLAGRVVGNDEAWLTELDTESFKKLIALNRNAVLD
ncbi:MAG: DEAD/DEAH box helicase [Synechococcales cyanobacterium RM1_1_8]|nr:DEAD/DEAH box helicase [Synechococcales cyanobacterium RM1_1_8]